MTTLFTRLSAGALLLASLSLASCEKDEVKTVASPGAAPTLSGSANNLTLLKTSGTDDAVTYTWTPVSYGYQGVVSYTLQFDKQGGDFSNPVSFTTGSATTKTLSVAELNSIYLADNLVSDPAAPVALAVRVISSLGPKSTQAASAVSSITATPYSACDQPDAKSAWAIIGPAGTSWDADLAMKYDCVSKAYTYTGPMNADDFKFRYGGAWDANLGGDSSTGGALKQNGANLHIAKAGTYTIVLTPAPLAADKKSVTDGSTFTIK